MKNLFDTTEEINQMVIEMMKTTERLLDVAIEFLSKDEFEKVLYGEAKVLEEELNEFEIRIDERGVEAIARFQPAASSLRKLIGYMDMDTDFERMGDLSTNTVKLIKLMHKENGGINKKLEPLLQLANKVRKMNDFFIEGYIESKIENAYMILGLDDEIDREKFEYIEQVKEKMKEDLEYIDMGVVSIIIAKNFERIADYITNLAETLIYIKKGDEMRHKRGKGLLEEVKKMTELKDDNKSEDTE